MSMRNMNRNHALGARTLRRLARKRGVSPIIATILLVAITVVLAAVLYVLISGLTHAGTSVPYTLSMGTPTWSGGSPNYGTIQISGATTGLTTSLFGFAVATSTGSPVSVGTGTTTTCKAGAAYTSANCGAATGNWYVVLYYTGNGTIGNVYSGGSWTGASIAVHSGTLALVIIGATALQGSGDVLNAAGTGSSSVSGTSGSF